MTAHFRRPSLAELTAGPLDADDALVLGRLASLYDSLDPVPTGLVERLQFGITLDALHAEVAELQRDAELTGVRSGEATEAQTVTFTSSNLTTMVTITAASAERARIDGWAAPGAGVVVELRTADQTLSTTADGEGRFVFEDVQRGLAQFVLRPAAGSPPAVVTPSIEI
ncbi:MAG: carboxypeptidase regulatory-like domain-containing protein [Jatrophihabitantaceae bacterium]